MSIPMKVKAKHLLSMQAWAEEKELLKKIRRARRTLRLRRRRESSL